MTDDASNIDVSRIALWGFTKNPPPHRKFGLLDPDRNGKVEEFSIFENMNRFPVKSHVIGGIFETIENKIWVVCSNESWNQYKGIDLTGGLWEYTGEEPIPWKQVKDIDPWFIYSYTKLDDKTAIVGTNTGFVLHCRWLGFHQFDYMSNYTELSEIPRKWVSTCGVPFGDFWLFGTGSGILAYCRVRVVLLT